ARATSPRRRGAADEVRMSPRTYLLGLVGVIALGASMGAGAACSASDSGDGFETNGEGGSGSGGGTTGSPTGDPGGGFNPTTSGNGGSTQQNCDTGADEDGDK